jgi:hypothetical protein
VPLASTLFRQDLRRYAGFPQRDESDCHYGSHKAITEHLGRVATLLTSFRGQPPSPCGSTGCAWIYKPGVTGILSTFSLLTFTIEIPVELFQDGGRGRSLPVVAHAKSGWSNWSSASCEELRINAAS